MIGPGDVLLIVDVQNDFCPGGSLPVAGGDAVAPVLTEYARRFHAAGLPVIAARDWHPPVTRHFLAGGGTWPVHCVMGTHGAEFHPDLLFPPGTLLISKGMDPTQDGYSAFDAVAEDGRDLPALLRALGARQVFIGGLATDYCVRASAHDAFDAGFEVVVLTDAVRGVNLQADDAEAALHSIRARGGREMTLASLVAP